MGQFKPMVKMETTEPSVELKLKKGGKVAKKADGGMMGSPMSAAGAMPPSMPARGGMAGSASPMKPSLMQRRRAMRGMPAGAGPAGPVGSAASMQPSMPAPSPTPPQMPPPAMKKGGKADMPQDKAMIKKAFKQHDMQEHKGGKGTSLKLKHGGKMATGGVVNGQGGFAKGGIINTEGQGGKYRNTKMDTSKPDHSPAKTDGVKNGNGGGFATGGVTKSNAGGFKKGGKIKGMMDGGMAGDGMGGMMNEGMAPYGAYKKGGSTKKAYAAGGTVNSGRPVAMPQGRKPASKPVRINELAGTYKTGGTVAPQKMSTGGGSSEKQEDLSKGGHEASKKHSRELEDALNPLSMVKELAGKARDYFMPKKQPDSVTKTKESVTVTPVGKKRGGMAC